MCVKAQVVVPVRVPVAEVVAAGPRVQGHVQGARELLVGINEGMILRADVQPQLRVAVQLRIRRGGDDQINVIGIRVAER
jgi:hypothetical protein